MDGAPVTIVMYHYVRDLRCSRYPKIKGLHKDDFAGQIQYIKKHYNVISGPELMNAIADHAPLPPRPLLLTFDDGYMDHYTEVFPVLDREGLPGCFFPSAKCVLEHQVLDVNKIHFVLANVAEEQKLVDFIIHQIEENRDRHNLLSPAEYWEKFGTPGRYDSAQVMFVKRLLQRELPLELRRTIADELFRQHVTEDEASFSKELYMSPDQLRVLQRHGMYVGSHGYDHFWLNTLSPSQQIEEIDRSLAFLNMLGADQQRWMMCYPYGGHNESLLELLQTRHCVAGLTTKVGIASLSSSNALTLQRLDTNDLPMRPDAEMSQWTIAVQ